MKESKKPARVDAACAGLIDRLCALCGAPASPRNHQRCELRIDKTLVTLIPSAEAHKPAAGVVYFAEVANVSSARKGRVAVELLEANLFLVGRDAPKFCLNPVTGSVVMTGYIPLDRHTPESAHELLRGVARLAAQFRDGDMLKPAAASAAEQLSRLEARPSDRLAPLPTRRP